MRGRLSFALTACTLLFLLHGLSALAATLFATFHDALYPRLNPLALLPALIPLVALCAPMLPIAQAWERRRIVAGAVAATAAARVLLCLPQHPARLLMAALVVAAGGVFLSAVVGFVERRRVAGGLAAAIVLDQLLRLAGWSWDVTMRAWWLAPQLVISGTIIWAAWQWAKLPIPEPGVTGSPYERRAGGLRLRGAGALAVLLFLDLNVLARAEVAARWLGVRYEAAAVLLVTAGAAATLVLLAGHGPLGRYRPAAVTLALLALAGVLLPRALGGWPAATLLACGHAAALLLIGRALVPAGGRRKGVTLTAGLLLWLVLTALYVFTFHPSFTIPALRRGAVPIFASAGVLLLMLLVLLPRPLETQPPLRGRLYAALALLLATASAVLLAMRPRTLRPEPNDRTVRIATWNVHLGFGEDWRFDPARIAETIEGVDPDLIALQEVGSALPAAYGVDLAIYLSRRLGMQAYFAPTHNGLLGDAILTRLSAEGFSTRILPPATADARQLAQLAVPIDATTMEVFNTRLGLDHDEQLLQARAVLAAVGYASPAVLLGDFNATAGDSTIALIASAGFRDAFAVAGVAPRPTQPAARPVRRIDWIWLRGLDADSAAVVAGRASDHRMVSATVRTRAAQR